MHILVGFSGLQPVTSASFTDFKSYIPLNCERASGVKPDRNKCPFHPALRKRAGRRKERLSPPLPFFPLHSSLLPPRFLLKFYSEHGLHFPFVLLETILLFWKNTNTCSFSMSICFTNLGHIRLSKVVKVKPEQQHCWQIQFKAIDRV